MEISLASAKELDRNDPLAAFRNEFIIPELNGQQQVYFLGNSLGLQPKRTATYIENILKQWARYGVESFFMGDDPWISYHDHLVSPLARIVGAKPAEIVVMNQLTVNLHLMMVSFYRPSGIRRKIICEGKAFPSDQYMLETHIKHLGLDPADIIVEVNARAGEYVVREEDIISAIKDHHDELALVFWGGVNYYTGQVFDMEAITKAGHAAGALVGFDLAHAAGNIPLRLHDWNVDFACWCSYKYLNAGPGAIGAAFIHERYHTDPSVLRLAGWWGYEKSTRFKMEKGFIPMPTAEGWQLSTPSPILYAAHRASLEIFEAAGFEQLHKKSRLLSEFLLRELDQINLETGDSRMTILTPREPGQKGCQVSILFRQDGRKIFDFISENGIFADWREPDVIRIAPVPLYNSFQDILKFSEILKDALRSFK